MQLLTKFKTLIFASLLSTVSACSQGGAGLGPRGSPIWFETASVADIKKYKSEVHKEKIVSGGAIGSIFNKKGSIGLTGNFDECIKDSRKCDRSLLTPEQIVEVDDTSRFSYSSLGRCAENGSCYGDTSILTGRAKTVSVRGYYRSDGTYVRGHYRSK